jgi:hypothetical protein
MDRTEQLAQIDAAWERITEAAILMDNVASKTADMQALDIWGLLEKADRQMGAYRVRAKIRG